MKYVMSVWVVCAFLSASPGAVAWQSAQSSNSSSTGVGATGQTSPAASAAVPRLIKFSGVLRDLAGKPSGTGIFTLCVPRVLGGAEAKPVEASSTEAKPADGKPAETAKN